jgi:hypothetical protein
LIIDYAIIDIDYYHYAIADAIIDAISLLMILADTPLLIMPFSISFR